MKINKKAVENFIATMDKTLPIQVNLTNASLDAHAYRWNYETLQALKKEIMKAYEKTSSDK